MMMIRIGIMVFSGIAFSLLLLLCLILIAIEWSAFQFHALINGILDFFDWLMNWQANIFDLNYKALKVKFNGDKIL